MKHLTSVVAALAAATITASGFYFIKVTVPKAQVARGHAGYQKSCASCHGANLEGQPHWQTRKANGKMPAPPHDISGHTWHHSDADIAGIIKLGLKPYVNPDYESDMPAFKDTLTDAEISDILAYLKSTWPDRQRDYQERITAQSKK